MKKVFCITLSLIICFTLFGCSSTVKEQRYSKNLLEAFDTVTSVVAYDKNEKEFSSHFALLKSKLEEYDRLFSIYEKYDGVTNLCEINEKAKIAPIKTEPEIIELLSFGKECYSKTNGAVNICMGSVLHLWHDAREASLESSEKAYIPDKKALKEAAKHTDVNSLVIDKKASTVFFKDRDMSLDVGAIAKGFASDKIANWLRAEGIWSNYVISIGGNVITSGYKDEGVKWNIEIENPNEKSASQFEVLSVTDKSVVTSGDYQRFFTYNNKKYAHIIDPETLMPSELFSSVSVIANNSALADALSTALFILPLDEGKRLIENLDGVEAMWADKKLHKTYSSGFEGYIKK